MNERFLVTGAHGCIGSWVVAQLVREGADVIAADADPDDRRLAAILEVEERAAVRTVLVDISKPEEVAALFELGPTHVIHLAALQVPFCRADPIRGAQVNVVGTVAMLAAAEGLGTPLVYASSAAAFAALDAGDVDPSGHPETYYGVYKFANEETARVFHADRGVSSIGLRPYVVYGPGRDQGLTSAPTMAMRAAVRGEDFTIPYSGTSQLQFAPDAAAAFVAAARAPYSGATVLNIPGIAVSVAEIVQAIERLEPAARIHVEGASLPFPPVLETSAFASVAGEVPVTALESGITATLAHYRT